MIAGLFENGDLAGEDNYNDNDVDTDTDSTVATYGNSGNLSSPNEENNYPIKPNKNYAILTNDQGNELRDFVTILPENINSSRIKTVTEVINKFGQPKYNIKGKGRTGPYELIIYQAKFGETGSILIVLSRRENDQIDPNVSTTEDEETILYSGTGESILDIMNQFKQQEKKAEQASNTFDSYIAMMKELITIDEESMLKYVQEIRLNTQGGILGPVLNRFFYRIIPLNLGHIITKVKNEVILMPRSLRIKNFDFIYHIMVRSNRM